MRSFRFYQSTVLIGGTIISLFSILYLQFLSYQTQLETYAQGVHQILQHQLREPFLRDDRTSVVEAIQHSSSNLNWVCLKATRNGSTIYSEIKSSCAGGLFARLLVVKSTNQHEFSLEAVIRLPKKSELYFLLISVFVLLLIFFLGAMIYQYLRIKQAVLAKVNQVAVSFAHDIRSPLAALRELSLRAQDGVWDLALIQNITDRISSIASQMLRDVHPLAKVSLSSKYCDLREVLAEVQFIKIQEHPALTLLLETAEGTPLLSVSRDILFRALSNMINNSVEAVGGKAVVTVNARREAGHLKLRITDNGEGIPEEILAALARGESKSTKEGGFGLGLLSTQAALQEAGAQMHITRKEILMLLPICAELLLDDDPLVREIWRLAAARAKRDLVIMQTWSQALSVMKQNSFGRLYIDIRLSGVTDWDLVERNIRRVRESYSTEIWICSGLTRDQIPVGILSLAHRVIDKQPPFH